MIHLFIPLPMKLTGFSSIGMYRDRKIKMIEQNEVVMLVLGIGVLIFILGNYSQLKRFPSAKILVVGFSVLLAGWVLTVLEGFYLPGLFNFLEHICYAISTVLLATWTWIVFRKGREIR